MSAMRATLRALGRALARGPAVAAIGGAMLAALAVGACASSDTPAEGDAADGGVTTTGTPTEEDDASADAGADADAGVEALIQDPTLPLIHNASGASTARVKALVKKALDGLGFDPTAPEGPNPDDRVFVGRQYLVWIDETGFYGKMNGLWALDGAAGDALDFVLVDPDGRPVSLLIVGENGEGRFADGYKGAEHVEFPSRTPEANDNPSCATTDWCNQYGLSEAPPIRNAKIPWWSACNAGGPGYGDKVAPKVVERLPDGGLKLVYEGRLVKQADGDGTYDGDACHEDYIFPDGVRRRVNLRLGYELHPNKSYIDRTQQLENPAGNPPLVGDMSLIGGFVMTAWPQPHYLKRFNRFWRPETRAIEVQWNGALGIPGGVWTSLVSRAIPANDVIVAHADQPFTMSATDGYAASRGATISHVGPSDNEDVGGCLCVVHGAIELGGGLIHKGVSLPIAGGTSTIEGRRRLTIPTAKIPWTLFAKGYDPKSVMAHTFGAAEADGWSASTATHAEGRLLYGPYATDWGGGAVEAVFSIMVDNVSADDLTVVTIDINDATTDEIVSSRDIHRRELRKPMTFQRFTVDADLAGRAGHTMEARVYWHDVSYAKVGSVTVNGTSY